MKRALAVLIALSLTAFAPAPLPRKPRESDDRIDAVAFQGEWLIVSVQAIEAGGGRQEVGSVCKGVRVANGVWTYVNRDGSDNARYPIVISVARRPAGIDWFDKHGDSVPSMVGLIRRRGDTVEILGLGGARPEQRPASFEEGPSGWWVMTLQRQ